MSVLVIRTTDMARLKSFFEGLGLDFVEEKHGSGPKHFAHQKGDNVLEIYPAAKNETFKFLDTEPASK